MAFPFRSLILPCILSSLLGFASIGFAMESSSPGADPMDRKDAKGRTIREIRDAQKQDSLRGVRLGQEQARARARLLDAVRLEGDGGACLVFNRPSRECQVTILEFNQRAQDFISPGMPGEVPPPSPESVKAIRSRTLGAYLEEAFKKRPENPFIAQAEADARAQAGGTTLPEGTDSLFIARLFRDNWVSVVRVQNRMSFEIYASTDSGLIDSLGRKGVMPGKWTPARYHARDAAEDWIRRSAGLVPGEWGPPVKTAFGFARLKIDRKPPTLGESLPLLIRFANLSMNTPAPKWDSLGLAHDRSALERKAGLRVAARLLPRPQGISGRSFRSRRAREDAILILAASGFPLKNLSALDLPAAVYDHVESAYIKDPDAKLQPFLSEYGYWWIDILGTAPVSDRAPINAALKEIEQGLRRSEADTMMARSQGILESKKRDRISQSEEAAWRTSLESGISPEERIGYGDSSDESDANRRIVEEKIRKAKADWIAANLEIRADFR